jgi:hypothetical protein
MTTETAPLNEDMTFHESYGILPTHLMRMVDRMNISPSDWDCLVMKFGTDWDAIRDFINANRSKSNGSFTFPFGAL